MSACCVLCLREDFESIPIHCVQVIPGPQDHYLYLRPISDGGHIFLGGNGQGLALFGLDIKYQRPHPMLKLINECDFNFDGCTCELIMTFNSHIRELFSMFWLVYLSLLFWPLLLSRDKLTWQSPLSDIDTLCGDKTVSHKLAQRCSEALAALHY